MKVFVSLIIVKQQPELTVEVTCSKPILTEEKLESSNFMTINYDSIFSLPDTWQPASNQVFLFTAF